MEKESTECPWRKYTAEELDVQYSCSKWVTRIPPDQVMIDHVKKVDEASRHSRESVQYKRITYGPGEEQKIDLFGTESLPKDAPILVFIHGGYWQAMSLDLSAHMAKVFHDVGIMVAVIGYDLCPKVTFEELIEQNKQAMVKVLNIAQERGSRGVYLTGHSAGGHLTALLLATDWSQYNIDNSIIKGGAPISGIFDLRPFCSVSDNQAVGLTEERAWQFSPQRMLDELARLNESRRIRVIVGEQDSPEFKRQAQDLYKALASRGLDVSLHVFPFLDHFEVSEQLNDLAYEGTKILLKMMSGPQEG